MQFRWGKIREANGAIGIGSDHSIFLGKENYEVAIGAIQIGRRARVTGAPHDFVKQYASLAQSSMMKELLA